MTLSTRSAAELGEPGPLFTDALELARGSTLRRPSSDTDLGRYLLVLGQLGVLIALTYRFQLESEAFRRLLVLTAGGFAVHYFLPLRHRLGFFVALSFAGIVMVLGPVEAAWLIAIGLALIGVCHLPLPVLARVGDSLPCGNRVRDSPDRRRLRCRGRRRSGRSSARCSCFA